MAIPLRRPGRPAIIGVIVAAVLIGGFGMLADEVLEGDTQNLDMAVLMALRTPGDTSVPIGPVWLQESARDITSLGSYSILGLITIAVFIFLLLRRKAAIAWFVAFAVIGGTILSTVLKAWFDRPRPDFTEAVRVFTASFPSGHATTSAVVYLTLGMLLAEASPQRSIRVFFVALAIFLTIAIGLTRLYLGVHYPTDVIAGWAIGTAWALLCWVGAEMLLPRDQIARE